MGTACTEGFGSSFCGSNVEDAGNDEDVESNNAEKWDKDVHNSKNENQQFIDISIRACKLHEGKKIMEIMVDHI